MLHITRENINKNVPSATKRQFERTVKEWKNKGIVKGYLEYLINSLNKYTYGNLLKILIYGIYATKEQQIYSYSKDILLNVANDTYKQAKKERPSCPIEIPDILTWAYISKWLNVVSTNTSYEDYLSLLTMTASDEMYSNFLNHINQEMALTEEGISKLINKQQNRVISIKENDGDYSFSGVLENMTKTIGNKAYIKPFPNELCKFVAELDSHTTKMCLSLNDQIFNTLDKNVFYRYSDAKKSNIRYEVDGLVEGINLPPIVDHFHWCRSTITYQIERTNEKLEEEIYGSGLNAFFNHDNGKYFKELQKSDNKGVVKNLDSFIDENENKYVVDGKHIRVNRKKDELEFAEWFSKEYKTEVAFIPEVKKPEGIRTPDFEINGELWEFKHPNKGIASSIESRLQSGVGQSENIILYFDKDIRMADIKYSLNEIFTNRHHKFDSFNKIMFVQNNKADLFIRK